MGKMQRRFRRKPKILNIKFMPMLTLLSPISGTGMSRKFRTLWPKYQLKVEDNALVLQKRKSKGQKRKPPTALPLWMNLGLRTIVWRISSIKSYSLLMVRSRNKSKIILKALVSKELWIDSTFLKLVSQPFGNSLIKIKESIINFLMFLNKSNNKFKESKVL